MIASSRKEAKATGSKYYGTGRPCTRGHTANRYASDGCCIECVKARATARYLDKKGEILAKAKAHYAENSDEIKSKVAERSAANPEKRKQSKREEYQRNKQKYLEKAAKWAANNPLKVKQFIKNWAANNPDKAYQYVIDRRMKLKQRLPGWITQEEHEVMQSIYGIARQVNQETGVPHQVDHIIPLRGVNVSGLHVPSNLQILTAADNRAKTNTYII